MYEKYVQYNAAVKYNNLQNVVQNFSDKVKACQHTNTRVNISDGQKLTKKLATNSLTNFFKLHQ